MQQSFFACSAYQYSCSNNKFVRLKDTDSYVNTFQRGLCNKHEVFSRHVRSDKKLEALLSDVNGVKRTEYMCMSVCVYMYTYTYKQFCHEF